MCNKKLHYVIKCGDNIDDSIILVCNKDFGLKLEEPRDISARTVMNPWPQCYVLMGTLENLENCDEEVTKIAEKYIPCCDPIEVNKYKSQHHLTQRVYNFYEDENLNITEKDVLKIYFTYREKPKDQDYYTFGNVFLGNNLYYMISGGELTKDSSDDDLKLLNENLMFEANEYDYCPEDYFDDLVDARQKLIDEAAEEEEEKEEEEGGENYGAILCDERPSDHKTPVVVARHSQKEIYY